MSMWQDALLEIMTGMETDIAETVTEQTEAVIEQQPERFRETFIKLQALEHNLAILKELLAEGETK